tara:strand:- start:84 stop:434 length:351 start_codon:yes stop_codon:yes gene_type:complete
MGGHRWRMGFFHFRGTRKKMIPINTDTLELLDLHFRSNKCSRHANPCFKTRLLGFYLPTSKITFQKELQERVPLIDFQILAKYEVQKELHRLKELQRQNKRPPSPTLDIETKNFQS